MNFGYFGVIWRIFWGPGRPWEIIRVIHWPNSSIRKQGCFLVLRKPLLVLFCFVVGVSFSVFGILCTRSFGDSTRAKHQETTQTGNQLLFEGRGIFNSYLPKILSQDIECWWCWLHVHHLECHMTATCCFHPASTNATWCWTRGLLQRQQMMQWTDDEH